MYNPELLAWARLYVTQEYVGLAESFLVFYDYVLNFTSEVELIWRRKFTSTTLIYMVLRYLGLGYAGLEGVSSLLNGPVSPLCCFYLWSSGAVLNLILNCVLQGMMTMRVYALLGRPKSFLYPISALFVIVQCIGIASNLGTFKAVLGSTDRFAIAGLNVCNDPIPASMSWITTTSNALWMAYEFILCGAILRYAFLEIPASSWKTPTRSIGALVSVIVRDNLVYFFIVAFSMLFGILNAENITNIYIFAYGSRTNSVQVALIGPWIILNLRRCCDTTVICDTYNSREMSTIAFGNVEPQKSSECKAPRVDDTSEMGKLFV